MPKGGFSLETRHCWLRSISGEVSLELECLGRPFWHVEYANAGEEGWRAEGTTVSILGE